MPFKKGDKNINREGRPKRGMSFSDILQKILAEREMPESEYDKKELICRILVDAALDKDLKAISEVLDRVDGKSLVKVEQIGDIARPDIFLNVIAGKDSKVEIDDEQP